ncbi:MAG: GntR family transcriptional regulator [Clostridia bacterium]|nr:GntR family transcriptional regulator [Clostridia bacterium]
MLQLEFLNQKYEQVNTVDRIYINMLQDIVDGVLFQGYKIVEEKLCEKYQCSRTPIREVLRRLESSGLIEIEKNRGAVVVGFSRQSYMDMLMERREMEKLSLELAITRIKTGEMELLNQAKEFLSFYYPKHDIEVIVKVIKGFHQIIYHASYNKRIEQEMNLFLQCSKRQDWDYLFIEQNLDDLYSYYMAIYESFNDGNINRAVHVMDNIMNKFIGFAEAKYV